MLDYCKLDYCKLDYCKMDHCKLDHCKMDYCKLVYCKGKGKVVYGQEPPSGESTTTECGVNYQLLAVMY